MAKAIFNVSGSKGGVGKSITAMALVHYLVTKGEKVLLVEADQTNPDVAKSYMESVDSLTLNLDQADGWMDLANALEEKPDHVVVINSPARSIEGVKENGEILAGALPELKREMVTLWVINHERDSLELLKQFLEVMPRTRVHVIRNLHHAPEEKFDTYNQSKLRVSIERHGGKSVNFPAAHARIATPLRNERLTIQKMLDNSPIGNRVAVSRWVKDFSAAFDEVTQ